MSNKMRVGIVLGGRSAEHAISLLSAKSVIEAINKDKYEVVLLGISKAGEWFFYDDLAHCLLDAHSAKRVRMQESHHPVALVAQPGASPLVRLEPHAINHPVDVIFPLVHGPYGEDGTIQGLLKLANVPFVGAGVLGSAVAMDKDVMKRLLKDAGIPIAPFLILNAHNAMDTTFEEIVETVGLPFFVKPANLGSSIGVSKVNGIDDFDEKIAFAFRFDRKIIVETFIEGRELECSVLGNDHPIASVVGELIPQHEFYSYEAKYLDDEGAIFEIPARLSAEKQREIQALALKTYKVLCCQGMARVDLFLSSDGQLFLNEINTIPGFTKISMYPKLWEASGLAYPDLIDRLISLAIERFEQEQSLNTALMLMGEQPVPSDLE
ncbi:MAG: D-alanine--D-alanine ligase [Gammaproteobacteria bacterium]|nr:D-alanine--D-alanine ligase [Gammaproteobacteria bacterium]MBP9729695.1 D-alanine--D-alanine ligase [Gammaproteobacteria bacterium]